MHVNWDILSLHYNYIGNWQRAQRIITLKENHNNYVKPDMLALYFNKIPMLKTSFFWNYSWYLLLV